MIVIKSPHTKEEFKKYYELRYVMLRKGLGLHRGSEKDDYEPISEHFIAVDDATGEIVGAIKLFEREPGVAQFSHIAVAEAYQRRGVGRMLVDFVENKAHEEGYKIIGSVTRVTAADFYTKCGYVVKGYSTPLTERVPTFWVEKILEPIPA